jgi:hypothetical protein
MRGRKNKTMKGGFWDKITDMFKQKPKTPITTTTVSKTYTPSSTTTIPSTTTTMTPTTTTTIPSTTTTMTPTTTSMGGRRSRRHKGGYSASHSVSNLASRASPFSGSKTAQPQVWLGGKSRKLRKSKKSRTNRRRYRK